MADSMIVNRATWGARTPKNRVGRLAAPLGVTYHWGGPPVGVRSHADCGRKVRGWQTFHMDGRGWADIAYSLVVCPHGDIFEGRGVHVRTAANGTNAGNGTHYAICYLGGEGEPLTDAGKRGLLAARDYLIEHGNAGTQVRTHNSWKSTGCPGPELEQWVADGCPCVVPPPPPPAATEDDDMRLVHAPDRPLCLLEGGRLWALASNDEGRAYEAAGVDLYTVTPAEWDHLDKVSKRIGASR